MRGFGEGTDGLLDGGRSAFEGSSLDDPACSLLCSVSGGLGFAAA